MGKARDVVEGFYGAFNSGRLNKEEAAKWLDPNIENVDPSGTINGVDAFLANTQIYLTAAPDSKITAKNVVESGDWVFVEGEFTGTNTGPLASLQGTMSATGKRFLLPFVEVDEVKNGKIAKHRVYFDQMTFLGQLGLLPQPAGAR